MTAKSLVPQEISHLDLSQYCGVWMIEESHAMTMIDLIRSMDWAKHVADYQAKMASAQMDGGYYNVQPDNNGVAVIRMSGSLAKGGMSLSENSSTIAIGRKIRNASRNPDVKAIVLQVDSPGGTAAGTEDLARRVREANEIKPVYVSAEDIIASAAYWPSSQATKIYAQNKGTLTGSIGTFMALPDATKMFEGKGVKIHVFRTGKHKGAGSGVVELSDENKQHFQNLVDNLQASFSNEVSKGRKITLSKLEEIADGRVFTSEEALKHGLIDGIKTFEEVLAEAGSAQASSNRKGNRAMNGEEGQGKVRAATLPELKSACPNASADFYIGQIERNATLEQAREAWFVDRSTKLDQREKALDERETAIKAREEAAEKKPENKEGGKVGDLAPVQGGGGGSSSLTATQRFESLVQSKVDGGMKQREAFRAVCMEHPKLREEMVEEANAS